MQQSITQTEWMLYFKISDKQDGCRENLVNKKTKENIYMVEWIISNKEWIFSGLGIAIISAFFAILMMLAYKQDQSKRENLHQWYNRKRMIQRQRKAKENGK